MIDLTKITLNDVHPDIKSLASSNAELKKINSAFLIVFGIVALIIIVEANKRNSLVKNSQIQTTKNETNQLN